MAKKTTCLHQELEETGGRQRRPWCDFFSIKSSEDVIIVDPGATQNSTAI